MKSFRSTARRLARLVIPSLTLAFWLCAIPPTTAQGRLAPPVPYRGLEDGGGDEWDLQGPTNPKNSTQRSWGNPQALPTRPIEPVRRLDLQCTRLSILIALQSLAIFRGLPLDRIQ
jgi:hypothetical protein